MKKRLPVILLVVLVSLFAAVGSGYAEAWEYVAGRDNISRYYQHLEVEVDPSSYVEDEFNSKLPIVSIDTRGQEIPSRPVANEDSVHASTTVAADGDNTIRADIKIYDNPNEYNQLSDEPDIESEMEFRIRGNSSRYFDKNSYKIGFVDEEGLEQSVNVMGMGGHDEWALYGPFLDKTLLRNYVFLNLYGEIDSATPEMRYCEVYINDEFQGLYLMMETIAVDEDRLDLTPYTTRSDVTSYILVVDAFDEVGAVETFTSHTLILEKDNRMKIDYPAAKNLTPEFIDYIVQDFSDFEKALYSYDYDDPAKGYRAHIDVDSFVDYYIINEFLGLNDFSSYSTYFHKDMGGKITAGPAWDYNNIADLYLREVDASSAEGFFYYDRMWFAMLLRDEYFAQKVIDRYKELRESGILNEERILSTIDDTTEFYAEEIDRNFDVWGYSFDPARVDSLNQLRPEERNPANYQEAITQLKNYIIKRGRWLDEHIDALIQYSAESKVKAYNEY